MWGVQVNMTSKKMYNNNKQKKQNSIWGYLEAIALVLGIHIFFYQPFTIPSGSMIPTLLIGDYIFVNKFSYGYSRYSVFFQPKFIKGHLQLGKPKRGEVAVFFHNYNSDSEASIYDRGVFGGALQRGFRKIRDFLQIPQEGVNYVKRVIGLPGDKIQMKEGLLYINGEPTKLDYVGDYPMSEGGKIYVARRYVETLPNGKQHFILKIFDFGQAHLDNTIEFMVPENCYFMMGDNRDNSCDSREIEQVGFIPKEKLVGRPDLIFFSTEAKWYEVHKWFFSLRWKRLLNLVK